MSLQEFENGYWYTTQLKSFVKALGIISVTAARKDELEKAIIEYLRHGKIKNPILKPSKGSQITDLEKGLSLDLPVVNYTSNKETKTFLMCEALKLAPDLPKKSGARYWLNRWREEKINNGIKITYRDLVKQFVKLSQTSDRLPRIPSTRFNNFITDFLANEKNPRREKAIDAWENLKKMDIPKNYKSWVKSRDSK